jgi:hypothetical protein
VAAVAAIVLLLVVVVVCVERLAVKWVLDRKTDQKTFHTANKKSFFFFCVFLTARVHAAPSAQTRRFESLAFALVGAERFFGGI